MNKIQVIDEILQDFVNKGSSINTINSIRPTIISIIENIKDQEPEEIIQPIIHKIEKATDHFLHQKNDKDINLIYGISSSILASGKDDWKLLFYGGKTNYDGLHDIDENTPFDMASVTKLYTLILKDKLVEEGYFKDSDKISDLLPEFVNMEDFTLEDLSLLCGELRTNGRIDDSKDANEALKLLKQVYLHSNDRTQNKYTDLGAIITAIVMTEMFNRINGSNYNLHEILSDLIFSKYEMSNTMFKPKKEIIVAGNGNNENLVHDPKARILGGIAGSAGLFTTPDDQMKFASALFKGNTSEYDFINDPVSPENIRKYSTITFPNSPQSNKGHFGIYVKNPEPAKFFCPQDYSDSTFVHAGWTGSYVAFDPANQIHNSIFTATVRPDIVKQIKGQGNFQEYIVNDKPKGWMDGFHIYQDTITQNTLIIKVLKEYLTRCYEDSKIDIKVYVR